MLSNDFLQFLYELGQNNNRTWFEQNKKRYEVEVKKPFETLVGQIIECLRKFEPNFQIQANDCIHRIYRDTRFSADKTPYKTHVSAVFTSKGRKTMEEPGYYLQLGFGNLMLGGGAYFLEKEPLRLTRSAIARDPDRFRSLIAEAKFVEKYGEIQGDRNKVMPPEFKEAAKTEPLLTYKQYYFMAEIDPEPCLREDFADFVIGYFLAGKPLNDYFKAAIGS